MTQHGGDRIRTGDPDGKEEKQRTERDTGPVVDHAPRERAPARYTPNVVERTLDRRQERDADTDEREGAERPEGTGVDAADGVLNASQGVLPGRCGFVGREILQLGNRIVQEMVDRVQQQLRILIAEDAFGDRQDEGDERHEGQQRRIRKRRGANDATVRIEVDERLKPRPQGRALEPREDRAR